LIISADFELAWAWQYDKKAPNPYKLAIEQTSLARKNIPIILELCETYNIPVTWATVGHLFLEKCQLENGKVHPEIARLPYFENEFIKYNDGDWFQNDPCTNWKKAPEWYAPDLIQEILNSEINHEIGCHTFSHIDCSDKICSKEVFKSEILACQNEAAKYGLQLKSFVHPGHTIGNLKALAELGFTSFQTDYNNTLGYPVKHSNGLWELKRTMEFVYRPEWSIKYHIYRYKKIVDRVIKYNTVCNFWFHPSVNSIFINDILPDIFEHIYNRRKILWSTTVKKYIDWLEKRNDKS